MNKKLKILGLIPARGGSKTVINKNIIKINNFPLIYYTIKEAKKSKHLSNLIVSTNSKIIAKTVKKYGVNIPFFRPNNISRDSSTDSEVINHAYNYYRNINIFYDYIVYLRPTSPLRSHEDIDKALNKMINSKQITSIRSVKKVDASDHPYWVVKKDKNFIKPFFKNYNFKKYYRKQLLPDCYKLSGIIDIIDTKNCNKKNIYGKKIGFFDIEKFDIDIDTKQDVYFLNKII